MCHYLSPQTIEKVQVLFASKGIEGQVAEHCYKNGKYIPQFLFPIPWDLFTNYADSALWDADLKSLFLEHRVLGLAIATKRFSTMLRDSIPKFSPFNI